MEAYPILERERLKTELSVLYLRPDMNCLKYITDLTDILFDISLQSVFSELLKLYKILIKKKDDFQF